MTQSISVPCGRVPWGGRWASSSQAPRSLTCPADPTGKILDELSFVQYLCDE